MNHTHRRLGIWLVMVALVVAAPTMTAGKRKKAGDLSPELLARHPEIQKLRERVLASPENAALHNDLGNLYARQGWDALALKEYSIAVGHDPDLYVAWTNRGTLYSKAGDLDKAARAFQTAVDIQPLAALAHYNLGVVRERLGDYDGALESYKTAVTFDPRLLDPEVNPQIVNNKQETAIRLLKYLAEVGSSSLPLEDALPAGGAAVTTPVSDDASVEQPTSSQSVPRKSEIIVSPAGTPDQSALSTTPDGMTGKSLLGSLKMFTGRAERRLLRRADPDLTAKDAAPGHTENGTVPDLSMP